jgi:hypothetical protein
MALSRVLACLGVVATALTASTPATASSTDACAQRVIRDWYDGGRVDNVYPLRCYRAAISVLPEDVLQYSDARNAIERALAYAARGEGARRSVAPGARAAASKERPALERSELAAPSPAPRQPAERPAPVRPPSAPVTAQPPRAFDDPVQLAAPDDVRVADARGLPYPVIVLATLAGLLLASAAAARLLSRRRGSGSPLDR